MLEFKGTPGPWIFEAASVNSIEISDENENLITEIIADNEDDLLNSDSWGNARLIAAAPDLLEALQALVASTYNGCSRKESQEQLEKAEAAITKALGGTNS